MNQSPDSAHAKRARSAARGLESAFTERLKVPSINSVGTYAIMPLPLISVRPACLRRLR